MTLPVSLCEDEKKRRSLLFLEGISKNPNVTQAELASILKYQRSSVSESMSKLQALGILKRVGSKKTGYWEIVKEDY